MYSDPTTAAAGGQILQRWRRLSQACSQRPGVEPLEARRLLSAGDLDSTFAIGGRAATDFGYADEEAHAVVVQPDGKVVVAGNASGVGMVRYTATGARDATFGSNGRFRLSGATSAEAMALLPDGKFLVAGSSPVFGADNSDGLIIRVNANGSLDSNFGDAGRAYADPGNNDQIYALATLPDGRFVVVGRTFSANETGWNAFVARYNADGSPDFSFGSGGMVITDFGGGATEAANAVVVQPDGMIVIGGYTTAADGTPAAALARYRANGSLDASFGVGGMVLPAPLSPVGGERINSLLLLPDGKLLGGGEGGGFAFTLFRFDSNGTLDNSFGFGGRSSTPLVGSSHHIEALARRSDGKIYAAGAAWTSSGWSYALARYTPQGGLDSTFSGDGWLITSYGGDHEIAYGVALTADAKIVVAGTMGTANVDANFGTLRFLDDIATPPIPYESAKLESDGTLSVFGSEGPDPFATNPPIFNDSIRLSAAAGTLTVQINAKGFTFSLAAVRKIDVQSFSGFDWIDLVGPVPGGKIDAGDHDDQISVADGVRLTPLTVFGGGGSDSLKVQSPTSSSQLITFDAGPAQSGPRGAQTLLFEGTPNFDRIEVNDGILRSGNAFVSYRNGVEDVQVYAGEGDDIIQFTDPRRGGVVYGGEGDDTIVTGPGRQFISGEGGDDLLIAADTAADNVNGGEGDDVAYVDSSDSTDGVEAIHRTSISGSVYDDSNGNGAADPGEQRLPGRAVYIDLNHNFRLDPESEPVTWTDPNGDYRLPVFEPGTVSLRLNPVRGLRQVAPAGGADYQISVAEGQEASGYDFGQDGAVEGVSTLRGVVFHDTDIDGQQDANEEGLAGWTVYDDANFDFQRNSNERFAVTDDQGNYSMDVPADRDYRLRLVEQSGSGYHLTDPGSFGYTENIIPQAGQTSGSFDFGLALRASITGTYFHDLDGDGHRSANEPPLPGWQVRIYDSANRLVTTATTDDRGRYTAAELPISSGTVTLIPSVPPGWIDSVASSISLTLDQAFNSIWTGIDFGAVQAAAVGGFVYQDLNLDGVFKDADDTRQRGWTVYADLNNNGSRDPGEPYDLTDGGGYYQFGVVPGGNFILRAEPKPGFRPATPADGALTVNQAVGTRSLRLNFGNTATALITGVVFNDADRDGVRDPGEEPRANVTVWIDTDLDGAVDALERVAKSKADGTYQFDGLAPGAYPLRQLLPEGRIQTAPADEFWYVGVGAGQVASGRDFGSYAQALPGRIEGFVFNDIDGDGTRDAGENPSASSITVYLDEDGDNALDQLERRTVTNANGYFFDGLTPGTYSVRIVVPSDKSQTFPAADAAQHVVVASGQQYAAINFGIASRAIPEVSTLRAAADAYVRDGSTAGTNFGGAADLFVKKNGAAGFSRDAYLRFTIPNSGSISAAKLRLFGSLSGAGDPVALALYASSDVTWGEGTITWNNKPAAAEPPLAAASVAGTTGQWYEFDVSDHLRAQAAAGARAVTFVLKGTSNTTPAVIFSSREAASNQPELRTTTGTPPAVEAMLIRGTNWTPAFGEWLKSTISDDIAYRLAESGGGLPLPWANLNQLRVRFTQDISATQASLRLSGPAAPRILGYSFESETHTGVWTLAAPLAAGRYHIELVDVTSPTGVPLAPLGSARDFLVLRGDVDLGGSVSATDLVRVRNRIGRSTAQPGFSNTAYDPYADINGDGIINASDLVQVRNFVGATLPPAPSAARALFSAVRVEAPRRGVGRIQEIGVL